MKNLLLLITLLSVNFINAQSLCNDYQGVLAPDLTVQTFSTTGGYYEFNATSGCTYVFSHCQNGGSYSGDPYLRITDLSNTTIAANDDWCGLGSELTWNSTVTGTVRVHFGVCCGTTLSTCSGGPTRVVAYWSTNCSACLGTTAPTTSNPLAQCATGSFSLSATSPDPLYWFATSNTTLSPIGTGSTYTTPTITSTTSYFVAPYSVANSCYGIPVEVICTIDQVDNITFYMADSILCVLSDTVLVNASPGGGTLTGTGMTSGGFNPAIGPGTYTIYYDLGDVCNSNDSAVVVVEGVNVAPSVGGCPGSPVTLTATGGPGINWFDDFNGSNVLDTGNVYTFLMDTAVSYYYATGSGVGSFYIDTIVNTNVTILDHNSITSDDRGGVAVTPNWFYVVGDGNTGRIDVDFTGAWTALPRRDGIVSDLQTGLLYTMWNGTSDPVGTTLTGYNWTHLAPMDEDLVINSAGAIPLSTPITVSGHGVMASGKTFMILWNNVDQTFYKVTYATGDVQVLGTGTPTYFWSENWADWGLAEVLSSGEYAISYRSNSGSIIQRYNINQGSTSTVVDFTAVGGVSDLSSFTVSPWNNRFYFHHEGGSGAFGGSAETGGFSDMTLIMSSGIQGCPVEVPVTVSPIPTVSLGGGSTICENDPITLDAGPGMAIYDWSTGESTQTISTNYNGVVSVIVTNSYGCSDSDSITLTVLPITEVNLGSDIDVCTVQLFSLNAGTGYFLYDWSSGQNTQVITVNAGSLPLGQNMFVVEASMANGCSDVDTIMVNVEDCAGFEELNSSSVKIYPNPSTTETIIDLTNLEVEADNIQLIDGFGRVIKEIEIQDTLMSIDVRDLPTGIYLININTGIGTINMPLSIQH